MSVEARTAAEPVETLPSMSRAPDSPRVLPSITSQYPPAEILRRLNLAARRGRMAGFQEEPAPALFSVEAFATPFEHKLLATASATGTATRLDFRAVMLPRVPAIFAVVIILSIWPGVWMTHSMLVTWFSWYPSKEWITWAWYLPLTVVPLPWYVLKSLKKSRDEAHADALSQIERLAKELDASTGWPDTTTDV